MIMIKHTQSRILSIMKAKHPLIFCTTSESFLVLMQGNGDGDKVESSMALAHNADNVNDDASDGKDIGAVHTLLDTEESALDGLTSVSVLCLIVSLAVLCL